MKRCPRFAFAALLCFAAALAARAQSSEQRLFSVYGTYTYGDYTFYKTAGPTSQFDYVAGAGFTVGASLDFAVVRALTLGPDIRISDNPGTPGGNTFAGSLKVGYRPTEDQFAAPYAQFGIGDTHGSTNTGATASNAVFHGAFGLDLQCRPSFDIRLIEVGVTHDFSRDTTPGVSPIYVSVGLVFHPIRNRKRARTRRF